ncbi:general stress protein [Azorhizobium oxalatiphilum]|uniref:General stress protein n=1 Tax=Azorhizobium oxalatiphilum TaxID=980631 RepID=A0A917BZC0_9HYPH|nr:pyridoxamine 5'-phosphate oxidase family protein [Azorhizobium oxalatiphilum]GGF64471.1 general stress protein [Azorhizobium oxalatiphilum]
MNTNEMSIHDIWQEMADRHACMLIDQDGGRLRARPMAPVAREEEGAIWFVTDVNAAKDDEIQANPQVCLAFSDEDDHFFLSVSGRAEVVRDIAKLKEIWTTPMEAYFPGGPNDPNALLLRVTPEQAECWQGDSTLVTGFKMAAAILGERKPDLGTHAKMRL